MDLRFEEKHCYRFDEAAHITPNSELYKALDLSMGRTVALKKITISGENPKEQELNYKRAMQEVKTMIQVSELTAKVPNIYSSFYEQKSNELYIAMQWINGETLADKMARNIPTTVFLRWMQELCQILDVMSKRHFQHKDIKPENIMFNENEDLYLIDFNISVSVPNQIEGTMFYKAPEMDFGSTTVARDKVDMFSIGVMLYQHVTGKIPMRMVDYECFDPTSGKWDLFNEPKSIDANLDENLNAVIIKLMSYNPKDRFSSYKELSNELGNIERGIRNARRNRKRS